ncbi:Peptidase C19 ubiquitin carboxyl-terminal hydrolase [Trinorchestia longiramus]|nr:Peptidase C19 ubiquitin carboxyl-terminal hydrolase [Trinorchestia longiramus]
MASRGNSVHGDDCSEAQASACRRDEMVRNSGLNSLAPPYIPTSVQSPRTAMSAATMNDYNASYLPQQAYESRPYPDVYAHDHNELSNSAGNGVYHPYLPMENAHLPVAYASSGQPVFYPGALMQNMYHIPQRPDMYGHIHHETEMRERERKRAEKGRVQCGRVWCGRVQQVWCVCAGGAREEGHPGSLNSTTPVCNNTTSTSSSSGTSHPPPPSWTSATSATAAAPPPPLLSTPPVSANSDNSSFSHMPHYFGHSMPKMPYSVQASGSRTPNKRPPDPFLYRASNPPPSNSMVTVQNCHVSVALFNNPGSYAGETQHHPANPGASLAQPPMNTSYASPYVPVCPGVPLPYGMYNHMDINYPSQGIQMRHQQPKPHRTPTDARISVPRGRGHLSHRGGSDRRPRHGEGDRSSIGGNRHSINEDGCDFADGVHNVPSNNAVDSHSSRGAILDSNSGISHHLQGPPLIINQPHRHPNLIPYSPMRVVAVTQSLSLGINAPQAEEPARDSGCSSPCEGSSVAVSTPISIPVSSPNLKNNSSTGPNGLAVDPSFNGPHAVQSNIAVSYTPDETYTNNSLPHANNTSYVPEAYVGPSRDDVFTSLPSNPHNGAPAYPATAIDSSGAVNITETTPIYNVAQSSRSEFDPSNQVSSENQVEPNMRVESSIIPLQETPEIPLQENPEIPLQETPEMPLQETPETPLQETPLQESPEIPLQKTPEIPLQETQTVYTATVTAHHQPNHSSLEVTQVLSNVDVNADKDASVIELEETSVSTDLNTRSVSPSRPEQSPESPGSELGDLKPIFETREEHKLSFTMTFGDLTLETIKQELEKNKTSLPITKPRVESDHMNVSLSITSSNPVFDTSICSPSSNTHSALDFGTMPENEYLQTSCSAIQSKETIVISEARENVDLDSKFPSSLVNDVPCSVATSSTRGSSTEKVATDFSSNTSVVSNTSVFNGGLTVTETEISATTGNTVLSNSVTAEKPPLPSTSKKQQPAMSNITARPTPAVAVAPVEPLAPSAPSAWGKNKNWKEEFKANSGDYRHKTTAIITPMIRNGVMEDDYITATNTGCALASAPEAAVTSPAAEAHTTTAMSSPVDGTALKMDKIKVGDFLREYKTNSNSVTMQPRGLTNKNYWCYANTVLQALTAVPQFVNLYSAMQQQVGSAVTPHTMPISHSIISYLKEFSIMNTSSINLSARARKKTGQNIVNLPEVQLGDPFEPSSIQNMLLEKPGGQFMEGCQQDAEEMLSFLLNASHDEFNECLKLSALQKEKLSGRKAPSVAVLPNGQTDESNDDWVTMGPKNKTCITRTTEFSHSPISEIFWGESRVIIKKGNSPVTNNLEPFITLPLDIQDENVKSVKEALHQFVSKADVAGYTCTDTQEELTVSSQRLLEQVPQVLILQLKRFVYLKDGGLQKVIKDISLSVDLEINKELISQQRRKKLSGEKVKYKLVSVIYHDGKDANKGHYVCNVYHPGYHCWLHYDDACVKPIVSTELQRCYAPRVPYLLFYRRADTFAEDTAPCAIQSLPNRRRHKDGRNSSADKISCERRADAETRPSNDGPSVRESHSRVSSIDRKPTSAERKIPEKSNSATLQKGNNKRQDKKQNKNKQELISQQRRKKLSGEKVKYKLVSVIYHDGKDANKGHYVCNVYHPGYHCWLHYDDACVKPIVSTELQRCYAPRVPYLLFYRRADTFAEDTAPCAIQSLPNRRRHKDGRNSSADKISCERRADAETRPSNDGLSVRESHSRVSSIDRKPTSAERKIPEKSNSATLQKGNNKRQDKKQNKNKQVAKN